MLQVFCLLTAPDVRVAGAAERVPHPEGVDGRIAGVLPEDEGRLLPVPGRGGHRGHPHM